MAEHVLSSLTMLTEFFTAEHIEAAARRTGFVKRASKITGKLFLALVTFGVWSDAQTRLAPLAAKVTPLDERLAISPEAIDQRMNKSAHAFLQEMIRHALATGHSRDKGCAAGLLTSLTTVSCIDRTGCGLPALRQDLLPGSGGSAATAGATMQAVWDSTRSGCGHGALTPWHMPETTEVDTVVT